MFWICNYHSFIFAYADGCVANTTLLSEGTVVWRESSIGITVTVSCPCGSVNPANVAEKASRTCAGDFTAAGMWEEANVTDCAFSMTTSFLCMLSNVSDEDIFFDVVMLAITIKLTSFLCTFVLIISSCSPSLPTFFPQNSNVTQMADLDTNDVGRIAESVQKMAVEATQNEEVNENNII